VCQAARRCASLLTTYSVRWPDRSRGLHEPCFESSCRSPRIVVMHRAARQFAPLTTTHWARRSAGRHTGDPHGPCFESSCRAPRICCEVQAARRGTSCARHRLRRRAARGRRRAQRGSLSGSSWSAPRVVVTQVDTARRARQFVTAHEPGSQACLDVDDDDGAGAAAAATSADLGSNLHSELLSCCCDVRATHGLRGALSTAQILTGWACGWWFRRSFGRHGPWC
jgi:hypothetical protein